MKKLKKIVGILLVFICVMFSGCSSTRSETIAPVEASGEKAVGNGISAELPKGWTAVNYMIASGQNGMVMTKGLSTVTVIAMDAPGISLLSVDEVQLLLEEQLKMQESIGAKIISAEQEVLETGNAICFKLENTVTQEMIEQNISAGVYTAEAAEGAKAFVGETIYEVGYYIINEDKMIIVDAVTYIDDAEGIKQVAELVGNTVAVS